MEGQPDNQTYLQSLLSLLTAQQSAAQQSISRPTNQIAQQPSQIAESQPQPNTQNNIQNILQAANYYPQMGQSGGVQTQNPVAMPFQPNLTPAAAAQQLPQQQQQPQLGNGFATDFSLDTMGGRSSPQLALANLQASTLQTKGVGDSKEKNRQAQRRFRERQKQMIAHLQEQVKMLSQKVDALQKQNDELVKENRTLKQQNGIKTSKGPGTKAPKRAPSPIAADDALGQPSVNTRQADHEVGYHSIEGVHQPLLGLGDMGVLTKHEAL